MLFVLAGEGGVPIVSQQCRGEDACRTPPFKLLAKLLPAVQSTDEEQHGSLCVTVDIGLSCGAVLSQQGGQKDEEAGEEWKAWLSDAAVHSYASLCIVDSSAEAYAFGQEADRADTIAGGFV